MVSPFQSLLGRFSAVCPSLDLSLCICPFLWPCVGSSSRSRSRSYLRYSPVAPGLVHPTVCVFSVVTSVTTRPVVPTLLSSLDALQPFRLLRPWFGYVGRSVTISVGSVSPGHPSPCPTHSALSFWPPLQPSGCCCSSRSLSGLRRCSASPSGVSIRSHHLSVVRNPVYSILFSSILPSVQPVDVCLCSRLCLSDPLHLCRCCLHLHHHSSSSLSCLVLSSDASVVRHRLMFFVRHHLRCYSSTIRLVVRLSLSISVVGLIQSSFGSLFVCVISVGRRLCQHLLLGPFYVNQLWMSFRPSGSFVTVV